MIIDRKKAILLLILTSMFWSFGGLFIKIIPWSAFTIAGLRSLIAAIIILIYTKGKILKLNKSILIGAFFYMGTLVCYVTATKLTTAANAILLQYTAPIWAAIFGILLFKDKVTKTDVISLASVGLGIVLFFLSGVDRGMMLGNVIGLFAGVMFSGIALSLNKLPAGSELSMVFYGNLLTSLVAIPELNQLTVTSGSIFGILFLGIFQLGISYIFFTKAVKHVSAIDAVLIPIIEPLFNPLWVYIVTREHPDKISLLGGLIVLVTIVIRSIILIKQSQIKKSEIEAETMLR